MARKRFIIPGVDKKLLVRDAAKIMPDLTRLLDEVAETHREIVITKRGAPVARLVPVKQEREREEEILATLRRRAGMFSARGSSRGCSRRKLAGTRKERADPGTVLLRLGVRMIYVVAWPRRLSDARSGRSRLPRT